MGVGRGISLQLLRLSRETQPGHVGGSRDGGGGRSLTLVNPTPISCKPKLRDLLGPFSPYKDTPLSRLTAHLAGPPGEWGAWVVR